MPKWKQKHRKGKMKVIDRSKYMEEGIVLAVFDRARQRSDSA